MAELKTKKTSADVDAFIDSISGTQQREDSRAIAVLMRQATKAPPRMWGSNIIGFGDFRYKYENGREGHWFIMGFSPRKQNLSLYLTCSVAQLPSLEKLGKHKTGKGCLYIKKLADIDIRVLKEIIAYQARNYASMNP